MAKQDPTKQELIARHKALEAVRTQVEADLRTKANVVGVGIGYKRTGGALTDEVALIVYVTKKLPAGSLSAADLLPPSVQGVPTDVQEVVTHALEAKSTTLNGGRSIANSKKKHYGTLGCCATMADGTKVILSNYHVLFADGAGSGTNVSTGTSYNSCNVVAHVDSGKREGTIDAAIAKVSGKGSTTTNVDDIGNITGTTEAFVGQLVRKSGAKTGLTHGKVTAVYVVRKGDDEVTLTDQIEVTAEGDPDWSDGGDSGSVVVDADGKVVGLHWGGSGITGTANRIANVLSELSITLIVSSAAHAPLRAVASAGAGGPPVEVPGDDDWGPVWQQYEARLNQSPKGREYLGVLSQYKDEVVDLVHNNRAVMLAWNTNKGPQFVDEASDLVRNPSEAAQKVIDGVSAQTLLENMTVALEMNGSAGLADAVSRYSAEALGHYDCTTLDEEMARIAAAPAAP